MAKTVTLRIDDELLSKFKKYAEIENRTISNFIETATLRYIEQHELIDDIEMSEIINNKELLTKLQKGSADARNMRGRFV